MLMQCPAVAAGTCRYGFDAVDGSAGAATGSPDAPETENMYENASTTATPPAPSALALPSPRAPSSAAAAAVQGSSVSTAASGAKSGADAVDVEGVTVQMRPGGDRRAERRARERERDQVRSPSTTPVLLT